MEYKYKIGDHILYDAKDLHEAARWGIEEIAATIIDIPAMHFGNMPIYLVDDRPNSGIYKQIPENKIIKKI